MTIFSKGYPFVNHYIMCVKKTWFLALQHYTFCTRVIENGVNIKTVQYWMGHHYVGTTIKIYLSISETKNKDEMTKIEGKIKLKWKWSLADIPKWKCQNISKLNAIGQEALILNRSKQR